MLLLILIPVLVGMSALCVSSYFEKKREELEETPVTFTLVAPTVPEKLYCLYCGRNKPEGENICHGCLRFKYVTLEELVQNLCRDVNHARE
jgi:hypothetical protein